MCVCGVYVLISSVVCVRVRSKGMLGHTYNCVNEFFFFPVKGSHLKPKKKNSDIGKIKQPLIHSSVR